MFYTGVCDFGGSCVQNAMGQLDSHSASYIGIITAEFCFITCSESASVFGEQDFYASFGAPNFLSPEY